MKAELSVIKVDLGKQVIHLHGANSRGKVVLMKRLQRYQVLSFMANLKRCTVVLEACGGAHYWGRELQKLGFEVKLIAPQFVKPFVKSNKNDAIDAEAICDAAQRPNMRFIAVKNESQQDLQNLHRIRQRMVKHRTALVNEIRGLLMEYGAVLPKRRYNLERLFHVVIDKVPLSSLARETFDELWSELWAINERIDKLERKLEAISDAHPICQRLKSVPGIGYLTATAVVASVGDPGIFKNGREFAAYIGLVPRQHTTGGKPRLPGISKRGDRYLRFLFVHGARATMPHLAKNNDNRSNWLKRVVERRGFCLATVALANKNARIAWTLMAKEGSYEEKLAAA